MAEHNQTKATNARLKKARKDHDDEFYTMYSDIEKEMQAYHAFSPHLFRDKVVLCPTDDPEVSNFAKFFTTMFDTLGLKKLICTSYANPHNPEMVDTNGRLLVVEKNNTSSHNHTPKKWEYLQGDGDFRSPEVTALRDEADIVVTNPPFSLFREFMAWLMEGNVLFSVIGNMNALTYKSISPLIRDNKLWLGPTISGGSREFRVPDNYPLTGTQCRVHSSGTKYISVKGVRWFTNIEHSKRKEWLHLNTMEHNRTSPSAKPALRDQGYIKYTNYDAIEVPTVAAIPSDYNGAMGVPISFFDKYNPEQFEILGTSMELATTMTKIAQKGTYQPGGKRFYLPNGDGTYKRLYDRIVIIPRNN